MKCPTCNNINLLLGEKQGVEIDYCPECRGIWLEKGRLEKIIERINESDKYMNNRDNRKKFFGGDNHHDDYDDDNYNKHRRKKSFLSDLFD